jgi:hypothetical protein
MAMLEGAPLRLLRRFSVGSDRVGSRSLDNEQFVETVIRYCRHRRNAAPGNQRYEQQETKLRGIPPIPVQTVFVCGTTDACNLSESSRGNEELFPAGLNGSS